MAERPWRWNISDGEWLEQSHGERFQVFRKPLSAVTGGCDLGVSLYRLPPGKSAFPHHAHLGNEEALFILEGSGQLRLGDSRHEVTAGDFIPLPEGPEHSHSLSNQSDAELLYLCLSTMKAPDVIVYPDSDKIGVMAGAAPGGNKSERTLTAWLKNQPVDYWQDE